MSFKAQDISHDAKPSGLDEVELSDNSSKDTVVTTSVSPPSPIAGGNHRQSNAAEDECDSVSAAACVDENFNTVSGEVLESPVDVDKPATDTLIISSKNCTTSSDAVASNNVAKSLTESCSDKKIVQQANDVELHSVVDVTSDVCFGADSDSADMWNDENDSPNLLSFKLTLIPDGVLYESSSGKECSKTDQSDSDDVDAELTSMDVMQDECSSVLFIDDLEHNDNRSKLAGPHTSADFQKTSSKSVLPARFMSPVDRRARPVPLPRSKTFRTKSASESLTTSSNRSSIPVEYETCSSIQSKVCQTMTLGDECESIYSLPAPPDFSEIYVDHKTIGEWHDQESTETAVYISSYDTDYDVLREVVSTSEGYKILPHGDSGAANATTTVLPSYESDYDLLKYDVWADVSDADVAPMHRQTEVKPGHSGLRTESGYDLLRDDVWTSSDAYKKTEILPESGLPPVMEERNSQNAGTWHNISRMAKLQHMETRSPPVNVCVEQSIIFSTVIFFFIDFIY